jgi:hypothetical protein
MERGYKETLEQHPDRAFEKVIAKIGAVLDRGFCQPAEREALAYIQDHVVPTVSNVRDEIALSAGLRYGRTLLGSGGKNSDAHFEARDRENWPEPAPTLLSGDKHGGRIRHNFQRKAHGIVLGAQGQVEIPKQRIVWSLFKLHGGTSLCRATEV